MSYAKKQKPLNQADVNQDSFQGVTAKRFPLENNPPGFQTDNLNQLIPRGMQDIFMGSVLCGRHYMYFHFIKSATFCGFQLA